MSDHLFSYLDDLLRLQSTAADKHNHKGVLGAVREDFVIQVLKGRIDNINLHNGEVVATAGEMGQHDVIIRRQGTINPELGGQVRIDACDCSAIIEVKSNAKGTEIAAFDQKAKQIKADRPNAICGLVCYKIRNRKETILKRSGHRVDRDVSAFVYDDTLAIEYQALDFILCLDEDDESCGDFEYKKSFFIKRGIDGQYSLFLDPPYMKYFLNEVNAAANPQVAA